MNIVPITSNQPVADQPTLLVVLQHKIIDKQMAYLILHGIKKYWMKLCDADTAQTAAIIKYEQDKLNGVQPMYYPQADHDDQQKQPQTRKQKQKVDANCIDLNQDAAAVKYNLRVRELLLISKSQFYGLKPKEEKKQNIVTNSHSKSKRQIKKQQSKTKQQIVAKMMDEEYQNSEQVDEDYTMNKPQKFTIKKRKRKPKVAILNVDYISKKKQIKKQTSIKIQKPTHKIQLKPSNNMHNNYTKLSQDPNKSNTINTIQIYDGSDSQLKML